nr:hypothetical protein CFP56_69065 [Quercus suber]
MLTRRSRAVLVESYSHRRKWPSTFETAPSSGNAAVICVNALFHVNQEPVLSSNQLPRDSPTKGTASDKVLDTSEPFFDEPLDCGFGTRRGSQSKIDVSHPGPPMTSGEPPIHTPSKTTCREVSLKALRSRTVCVEVFENVIVELHPCEENVARAKLLQIQSAYGAAKLSQGVVDGYHEPCLSNTAAVGSVSTLLSPPKHLWEPSHITANMSTSLHDNTDQPFNLCDALDDTEVLPAAHVRETERSSRDSVQA